MSCKWSRCELVAHRKNVTKGGIGAAIKAGCTDMAAIKGKTKAGSGCGGCVPLVTAIYKSEMQKAGHTVVNQ